MNILLVRPKPDRRTINLQSFMICEPLELEYLAAYLEPLGHTVQILDLILEKKPLSFFLTRYRPDLVGFTGYLPHINVIKQYAAQTKAFDPGIITVVGGVHADVRPQDCMDPAIDHVVSGNGMEAMRAIVQGEQPPEAGLDCSFDYPYPARGKTKRYRRRYNYIFHDRCATIKTSFGCPYRCEFCFCACITKGGYFCRELHQVMEELQQIEEKNIFIVDDNFLFDPVRVEQFCHMLLEYNIQKRFILFGRADFIAHHPELIQLLKSVGLHAVFMGIESFRQKDLDSFHKKTAVEENLRAVSVLEQAGVLCYCGLMVGHDWDRSDFDGLIAHLKTFRYPLINVQPVTPIPGTPYYETMREELAVGLDRRELWDMAHLLIKPTKMSERDFYANLLRVYYKTSLLPRVHGMIFRSFGIKAYMRACKGAICITRQYRTLIRKGCILHEKENSVHTANHL